MTQPDPIPEQSELSGKHSNLANTISAISQDMRKAGTGDLAQLRRMAFSGERSGLFWQWKAQHAWRDTDDPAWEAILTGMAMLTPKGAPFMAGGGWAKDAPHGKGQSFGTAMSLAKVSPARLNRLLASRGEARRTLTLRTLRMLARENAPINFVEVARFLLYPDEDQHSFAIARPYFKAAQSAARTDIKETQT